MGAEPSAAPEKRHWVRLTRFCNQRCLFCHDRYAQTGGAQSLAFLARELARGRKKGLRRVVLSGGEPTVHPDFVAVVAMARRLGYGHIQTITNGRRTCYPDFLDAAVAAGLGEITFSLHGHTPALHDALTQVPGSFVQAVAGLRRALATPGLIVSVDVVINRLNLSVLREHLDFCVSLGVREFDLLALVPFGDAWKHRERLACDFGEPESLRHLHRALELSRRPDLHLWTNRLKPQHLEGFEALIQPPEKILDELNGRRLIFARYLNGGRRPGCEGESCESCFLRDFCDDVKSLKREGTLPPRRRALCLGGGGEGEPFRLPKGPGGVFALGEFYIRRRYFLKSRACAACPREDACDGLPVSEIKRMGFGAMRPPADAGGPR